MFKTGHVVIIDTPAGTSQRLWNLVGESYTVLIPTSLSNADLTPTESFIRSMDKVKARYNKIYPHIVVCPNRIPFGQKDFSIMAKKLANHDVVIGPAIRDLASVRHFYNGTRDSSENAEQDFGQFSDFIEKFVLKGELDKIYNEENHEAMNVVPFQKTKKSMKK